MDYNGKSGFYSGFDLHGRATISSLSMLEATDFIQIHFLGKLSTCSLREKYQLRDKKYSTCAKPLVYFFMLSKTGGVSRPSWRARHASLQFIIQ